MAIVEVSTVNGAQIVVDLGDGTPFEHLRSILLSSGSIEGTEIPYVPGRDQTYVPIIIPGTAIVAIRAR
jgi:hypothetical protein